MITVFGLGFTGITTALYFCERKKFNVFGIDIDKDKTKLLKEKKLPFKEERLEKILINNMDENFLITDDYSSINKSKYIFICVDTSMKKDKSADLDSVYNVLDEILNNIDTSDFRTIIIKSSIPPTTTDKKIIPYIESKGFVVGKDLGLCVNPEFLREGLCHEEIENPNRIVIGCNDEKSILEMNSLYEENNLDIVNVNCITAEYSKYLSNSFIANLISFSNDLVNIADSLGNINVNDAFKIIQMDKRWENGEMKKYVHPTGKYGGYCLPKDTNALYYISKDNGYDSKMMKSIINVNDELDENIYLKIVNNINKKTKIGILGLSFKPNSDDCRNTSSYYVIKKLLDNGYNNIYAYDPISIDNFKNMYDLDINYIYKYKDIIELSDILIILTRWDEFKNIKKDTSKKVIDFTHTI